MINTPSFKNTVHLGIRWSDENRSMKMGDVKLKPWFVWVVFLEFTERQTKTRQGETRKSYVKWNQKCLLFPKMKTVAQWKCVRHTLHNGLQTTLMEDDPFYIATHTLQVAWKQILSGSNANLLLWINCLQLWSVWLLLQVLKKNLTYHSAWKHLVQKLSENNVLANHIMQIIATSSRLTINSQINETQHKAIFRILSTPSALAGSAPGSIYLAQQNTAAPTTSQHFLVICKHSRWFEHFNIRQCLRREHHCKRHD